MAKGEQKSNRETKKPKSDKNKKGGTPPHLMQQSGQSAPIVNQKKK